MNVKVSICCITYNHENFIAQTIEGFLLQATDFNFEIIIVDDRSGDKTEFKVRQFQERYPEKIKYYRHEINMGMVPNFKFALEKCLGEYIAICEGDDYWTDTYKLQKQVDFLDANHNYVLCFHQVKELLNNRDLILSNLNPSKVDATYTIEDLAKGNFIHTPSVMIKNVNGLIKNFPEWFTKSPVGDYALYMLIAKHGLIKFLSKPMAVYRRHKDSAWSSQSKERAMSRFIEVLDLLLYEDFNKKVHEELKNQKRGIASSYLKLLLEKKDIEVFLKQLDFYSNADEQLSKEWLLVHYPNYIKQVQSTRINKLARSISELRSKICQRIENR